LIREALKACPFVVVSDCWDTDTTALAHMVLPAAAWSEKDGTVTNSERRISRQRPFRMPPGEAKPDWWMITEVARRMGWTDAFPYRGPADIFCEHAALSGYVNENRPFNISGLAGLSDEAYDRMEPVRWPVLPGHAHTGSGRLFGDGEFATDNGRARFIATPWRPPAASTRRDMPFMLNTGRIRDQWHTMTRTGEISRLMTHREEPFLEIHPDDAGKLGVEDGGLVRAATAHGTCILRCEIVPGQKPGEVFAPMHWSDRFCSSGPINRLVTAARDPVSGQPELKATPARLAPVPTMWRGLLFTNTDALPSGPFYAARIPVAAGYIFELRGWEPLPKEGALAAFVATLLGKADGVAVQDLTRGLHRFAVAARGHLQAALFLSKAPEGLPEREKVIALAEQSVTDDFLVDQLAIPTIIPAKVSPGPIVCTCLSVRASTIRQAIRDKGLRTCKEIGAALGAGTSCGSCVPEINCILRAETLIPA